VGEAPDRRLLVRDLENLLAATKKTRESIAEVERRTRRTIRLVERQASIQELLTSFADPAGTATELTAVLDLLEAARLQTRRRIVHMGQAEGLSLSRLARFWGVSRQRVSRYAQSSLERRTFPVGG
jgi:C4-dicarboxylate-specific signal transduction histidine kinase